MKASFWELPSFVRYRQEYLDDEAFKRLQVELMDNPEAGDVIKGTGGLRKLRFADEKRGKGKRGGLRIIYYCVYLKINSGCFRFMTRTKLAI